MLCSSVHELALLECCGIISLSSTRLLCLQVSSDGASSSSGSDSSGVVFVSLVQNLINVEQSASGLDRSNLPPDDVFLSTQ